MIFTRIDYRYGKGTVKYKLKFIECLQILKAYLKSYFVGGCPADHMTNELENLLCGFDGKRHTIIRPPFKGDKYD